MVAVVVNGRNSSTVTIFHFLKILQMENFHLFVFFCRAASILHSNVYNLIKLYDKQRPQHPTLPDIIFTKRLSQKSMEE